LPANINFELIGGNFHICSSRAEFADKRNAPCLRFTAQNSSVTHLPADLVVKERSDPGIPGRPAPGVAFQNLGTENKKPGAERRAHSSHLTNSLVAQLMSTPGFVADLASRLTRAALNCPSAARTLLAIGKYSRFPELVKHPPRIFFSLDCRDFPPAVDISLPPHLIVEPSPLPPAAAPGPPAPPARSRPNRAGERPAASPAVPPAP